MALKMNDTCPVFQLPNQDGKMINIADYLFNQPIVIYFYPKDNTSGCTTEACAFRDFHDDFLDLGAVVFGISSDKGDKHQAFIQKNKLNFDLLTDRDKKVRQLFGVPSNLFGLIPGRVTYIINKDGKIAGIYNSQTNPKGHVEEAIKTLKSL